MNILLTIYNTAIRIFIFFLITIVTLFSITPVALAISTEQKKLIDGGIRYFDYEETCTTSEGNTNISSVYILGDSITVGAESNYRQKFTEKGITSTINASVGRSWKGGGALSKTADGSFDSGKDAVEADAAKIQSVQGVIIALGSNGGYGSNPIEEIASAIHAKNSSAKIWWVNTAGTSAWPTNLGYLGEFNRRLTEQFQSQNYQIINWFDLVNPGGDPTVSPTTDTNGSLSDGLHPSPQGIASLSDLVTNSVSLGGGSPQPNTGGGGCACGSGGGASLLPGNDNREKVWNYLVGTMGFTATQAAGIMGNLQAESGFNPISAYPSTTSEYPHGKAWGLAQWLGGRQTNLINFAREKGQPVNSLELQLEFLKKELEDDVRPGVLAKIRASTTVEESTLIFLDDFESPCNGQSECASHMVIRLPFSQAILSELGGNTASSVGVSGCSTTASLAGVTCPTNLEPHPNKKGYFKLPDAPNGEYTIYSGAEQRYGSQQLVCVLYSVALAFNTSMQGKSKLRIGDLNASGHKSHNIGIAVDLSGEGEVQAASHTKSWKGSYSKDATITLGKLFADTGVLRNIWWCPPNDDDSIQQITEYAKTKGLEGQIKCINGHADHFHVDIKKEHQLEFWEP